MVLRMEMPINPPTCCIVLTSAEATPESSQGSGAIGLLDGRLRRILGAGLDSFLGPSSLAFCLSLCGDAFCAGEMRRQELSGSVQCRGRFVEDRVIGLEDVRHPGGDVEGEAAGHCQAC